SAVGKNGISRTRLVRPRRFEQPRTGAQFHPKNAGLFRRSMFVRWFPPIQISQTIIRRPRFLLDPQRVIAIADDLWGKSLISKNGIALPFDDATLRRVRHEARISLDVVDHLMNRFGRCIDLADRFEFFQARSRMWAVVNREATVLFNDFPILGLARLGREDRQRGSGQKYCDQSALHVLNWTNRAAIGFSARSNLPDKRRRS